MDAVLRALAIYGFLLIVFRVSGKRTLAQITTFDLVLLLVIGEATQQGLLGDDFSVTNAFIVIATLVGTDIAISEVKRRFHKLEVWMDGAPLLLVVDGRPLEERMRKTRVDFDDVLEQARFSQALSVLSRSSMRSWSRADRSRSFRSRNADRLRPIQQTSSRVDAVQLERHMIGQHIRDAAAQAHPGSSRHGPQHQPPRRVRTRVRSRTRDLGSAGAYDSISTVPDAYARRFPDPAPEPLPLWLPAGTVPALDALDDIFGVPTLEAMRRPIAQSFEVIPLNMSAPTMIELWKGLSLTPFPARHAVPCAAIRLQTSAGTVVFSGDTGYHHAVAADSADAFFCEATYLHASAGELDGHGHLTADPRAGSHSRPPRTGWSSPTSAGYPTRPKP
jgi:hypothetical protein